MDMNLLIDSSVLIGLLSDEDSHHLRSQELLEALKENDLWVTEHVVDEVVNIMQKRTSIKKLKGFYKQIQKGEFNLFVSESIAESVDIFTQVMKFITSTKKFKPSYTDLHQIIVAQEGYLPKAQVLAFDTHFKHFPDVYFDYESVL